MVTVSSVQRASAAQKAGVCPGDLLISINGHEICDVLDYRFYLTEPRVTLQLRRGGDVFEVTLKKGEYDDIGLDFDTFLMDHKKHCVNKCVFCFIDQMPPGMRETLYFKDDDSRLSFLMGNYVTMTNFSEHDVSRMMEMHLSPLHISVHTTDPALRVQMMKNPRAGEVLSYLQRFASAGITMECQIVLCRGVNDGEHLEKTLSDLSALIPAINSVAVVPAGLTRFRENLCPLRPFDAKQCAAVIETIDRFGNAAKKKWNNRVFFASDEFYLKAGLPLPNASFYEDYPQIENGVGMIASMQEEFDIEMEEIDAYDLQTPRVCAIATGVAAAPFLTSLITRLHTVSPSLDCTVYPIVNDFFGHEITVAGLVTGQDLVKQLKGKKLGERLLIPAVMLRHEADRFLDDMTVDEVQTALGVPVVVCETDGMSFVKNLFYNPSHNKTN